MKLDGSAKRKMAVDIVEMMVCILNFFKLLIVSSITENKNDFS